MELYLLPTQLRIENIIAVSDELQNHHQVPRRTPLFQTAQTPPDKLRHIPCISRPQIFIPGFPNRPHSPLVKQTTRLIYSPSILNPSSTPPPVT